MVSDIELNEILMNRARLALSENTDSGKVLAAHVVAVIDLISKGPENAPKDINDLRQKVYNESRSDRSLYLQVYSILCYGVKPLF